MKTKFLFFTVVLGWFLTPQAQAHGVDFTQLKNCYDWTNLGLNSNEARGFRNSQYVGNVSHGRSANADIHALIYRQSNPDRVNVIQAGTSFSYNMSSSNLGQRSCQDHGVQDLVVPVRAHLHARQDSTNLTTYLSLRGVRRRSTEGSDIEMCPVNSANASLSRNGAGRVIPDQQVEGLVRQAIVDRLNWIAENVSTTTDATAKRNIERALAEAGACFKVVPEFPAIMESRNRVLCNLGVQTDSTCTSTGDNPAPQRTNL